jgi:hypothetical protein
MEESRSVQQEYVGEAVSKTRAWSPSSKGKGSKKNGRERTEEPQLDSRVSCASSEPHLTEAPVDGGNFLVRLVFRESLVEDRPCRVGNAKPSLLLPKYNHSMCADTRAIAHI